MGRGIAAVSAGGGRGGAVELGGAVAGLLLAVGLWTPLAGAVAGALEAWLALSQSGSEQPAIMLATLAISLAMIGPGAWSIDARLYGRKQLLPPEA